MLSPSIRNILGYDANDFLSGGLLKLFQLFHKDDYKIFNEKIFPANIQFLKKQPSSEHARFIFSHNNRVLNKSGDWLHLFIKNLYITYPNTALPHLNFVLAVDITDHKQDNLIVHRIDEEILSEHSLNKPIVINYYFPDNNEIHLSKQERKILGCLSEGLNSKQIAQRLHLSESTIINHRKNIQKKTSTKNVAELISFAFRNKILK
jgi:DNA-binding CsgD family transcriptional regulator